MRGAGRSEPDDGEVHLLLKDTPVEGLVRPFIVSDSPLGGLEIGVGGLTYALSTVGFPTAASCRAHGANSWTDYPIVLFGAHKWRAVLLAELAADAGCGIGQDRDVLGSFVVRRIASEGCPGVRSHRLRARCRVRWSEPQRVTPPLAGSFKTVVIVSSYGLRHGSMARSGGNRASVRGATAGRDARIRHSDLRRVEGRRVEDAAFI